MPVNPPVRLGVAGGRRGASFEHALGSFADRVCLAAICDPDDGARAAWTEDRPGVHAHSSFEALVDDPTVDAVLIATPMPMHAAQAVTALNAGKHVLSEVIAATTLDECWDLVETVERTGLTYMMAENYCYRREVMMVRNMAEAGLFGDITYAEGAYIHDCRDLMLNADFTRTWRGTTGAGNSQLSRGNGYPTHSLGPVAHWLGINRTDRLVRTATFVTKSAARFEWARSVLPEGHPDAAPEAWAESTDSATTIIETEQGRVIVLRKDSASPRPHNMVYYGLQGTGGAFISGRFDGEDPLAWIDGLTTRDTRRRRGPKVTSSGAGRSGSRYGISPPSSRTKDGENTARKQPVPGMEAVIISCCATLSTQCSTARHLR
jgi:predicted dehydrogenase